MSNPSVCVAMCVDDDREMTTASVQAMAIAMGTSRTNISDVVNERGNRKTFRDSDGSRWVAA